MDRSCRLAALRGAPGDVRATLRIMVTASITLSLALASIARAGDPCAADLDRDGLVGGSDLSLLLGSWGTGGAADLDGSGTVDGADVTVLLGAWDLECPDEPRAVLEIELAGRPLAAFPWIETVQSFNAGSVVTIGVDTLTHPELVGARGDLYVLDARSAAEWALDPTLSDVRGNAQPVSLVAGGLAANLISVVDGDLLGAQDGERFGRGYDLVLDLDANGVLDGGDLIDGGGDVAGFTILPNLTLNGPHAVTQPADYSVSGVTGGFSMERLYFPTNIQSMTPRPIVVISHGNGHDFKWYNYLGQHLASWGYVVMTHQNNTGAGVEAASTTTLQHTAALINLQATIAGGAVNGKLDANTIVWIGHSRGGEGVVRAYDRLFDNTFTPAGNAYSKTSIAQLISIAPTDFLGKGGATTGSDPHAVPYFLIYGAADGDVCGCPGNNVADSFNLFERSSGEHWSTYLHGADHNDFNCCGVNDFSGPSGTALGNAEVQKIAKIHILAAIKSTLENDAAARELRHRRYASLRPLGVLASAVVRSDRSLLGGNTLAVIDDFQTQTSTSISSSGGAVALTVTSISEAIADDANSSFSWLATDGFNGQTRVGTGDGQRGLVFSWSSAGAIAWTVPPSLADFTVAKALGFRGAQGTRHPNVTATDATCTVTLADVHGFESSISLAAIGLGFGRPYQRTGFGTGAGWQNETQLARIPLEWFVRDGRALDLGAIATVRLDFASGGDSAAGRLVIDDLSLLAE